MASRAFQPKPRLLTALDIVSVVLMLAATWMVFFYAPSAQLEAGGETQRIFYFHVATGWIGMVAFISAAVTGIVYLIRPSQK
ncbi:MAG TPA: hypothetical protein VF982_02275, partial [Anaerolineales bacterium]